MKQTHCSIDLAEPVTNYRPFNSLSVKSKGKITMKYGNYFAIYACVFIFCGTAFAQPAVEAVLEKEKPNSVSMLDDLAENHGYKVPAGFGVVRVPKPFPPQRLVYYDLEHPGQAEAIRRGPDVMSFRQTDGKLKNWSMTFGSDYSLKSVLGHLARVDTQFIDCPEDLLKTKFPGDWVVDMKASKEEVAKGIERILREEFKLLTKIEYKMMKREVWVASGKYEHKPLKHDPPVEEGYVHIFGKNLGDGTGGGGGSLDEYLERLGSWAKIMIVNEVDPKTFASLSWRTYRRTEGIPPVESLDAALKNATTQTGIEFEKGERKVQMLVIEKIGELKKKAEDG